MAKRTRTTSGSRSNYNSRKSSRTLKSKSKFSFFQVVILALVVALVGVIATVRLGDTSNAAGLVKIGAIRPGLSGAAVAPGYSATAVQTVGKIQLVGRNFAGATGIRIGNTTVPVTSVTGSGSTQTVTANLPAPATVAPNSGGNNVKCNILKTETADPTAAGNFNCGQVSPKTCTPGTAACNSSAGKGSGCQLMTADCNSSTSSVSVVPVNARGQSLGSATSVSTQLGAPRISSVVVSGNTTTITGTNLGLNPRVVIGHSASRATPMTTNNDGTETVSATVNTSYCFLNGIPLLNRLCNSAGSGKNVVKLSSNGQTSNSLNVNLTQSSSSPSIGAATAMSSGFSAGPSAGGGSSGNSSYLAHDSCGPGYVASNKNPTTGGTIQVTSPKTGDVWNIGSPQTFTWINPGTPITPNTNGVITHSGALAQVSLMGTGGSSSCIHYNLQHYLDLDAEGAALAQAADTDHDLCPANVVNICQKAWTENENGAPGCGTDPGGSSNCDTDDNFRAWSLGTDTSDKDGTVDAAAGGKMLCFGVLASGGRQNDPNVGVSGATVSITVSGCTFGRPPSGQYKAYVQVFGLSGPAACTPGHRCSGLPTKIQQAADGYSAVFTIN